MRSDEGCPCYKCSMETDIGNTLIKAGSLDRKQEESN